METINFDYSQDNTNYSDSSTNNSRKGFDIVKGIPTKPSMIKFNVPRVNLDVLDGTPISKIVPNISDYFQRGTFGLIIPQETIVVLSHKIGGNYRSYLQDLKGVEIRDESLVMLGDVKEVANRLADSAISSMDYYFYAFTTLKTTQQLILLLSEKGLNVSCDNFGIESKVRCADNKGFLRETCPDMMVNGTLVNIGGNWRDAMVKEFNTNCGYGINTLLRLTGGASGSGHKLIRSAADFSRWLDIIQKHHRKYEEPKIMIERALPMDTMIESPSCQCYMQKDGTVDTFSNTNQLLDSEMVHQGNVWIPDSDPISIRMRQMTEDLVSRYRERLSGIHGYFGVDFIVVDVNKLIEIFGSESKVQEIYGLDTSKIFIMNGKPVYMYIAEVNYRVTGVQGMSNIVNLYSNEIAGLISSIYNTISFKFDKYTDFTKVQDKIIELSEKEGLLFNPYSDKRKRGIFIGTIMPGKIQIVVIGTDQNDINILKDEFKVKILDNI